MVAMGVVVARQALGVCLQESLHSQTPRACRVAAPDTAGPAVVAASDRARYLPHPRSAPRARYRGLFLVVPDQGERSQGRL